LVNEVNTERQTGAREVITQGYQTRAINLDDYDKPFQKIVLKTFLTEFARNSFLGAAPSFTGTGIRALNAEVQREISATASSENIRNTTNTPTIAEANAFIRKTLQQGQSTIDIDALGTRLSKKRVIEAYINYMDNNPQSQCRLIGTGLSELTKEINIDRQIQARELIRQGYSSGTIDLTDCDKAMKKAVIKCFLTEFATNTNFGQAPKISGTGIIALNQEVQQEIELERTQASSHTFR
jgi:hypothetical protein